MKTLSFQPLAEETVGIDGCATPSICKGSDGLARIAVSGSKVVRLARQKSGGWQTMTVATAAQFPGVVDIADGVSVTSSTVADVVAGRCRTKGSGNDTYHGPWMTIVKAGALTPGPMKSMLITTGGCRAVFDNPDPNLVELWSKNGDYALVNVTTGAIVSRGHDSIGNTGEKLAVAPGGWRAFNGCANKNSPGTDNQDDSRVIRRGDSAVTWLDADTYDVGADERYPGMAVRPLVVPLAYLACVVGGRVLVNKVKGGKAVFDPRKLRTIGSSDRMDRHPVQLVPARYRMAAFWSLRGNIMAVDVDGAIAGAAKPAIVAQGQLAAACAVAGGIGLAVVRGGSLYYQVVKTKKVGVV